MSAPRRCLVALALAALLALPPPAAAAFELPSASVREVEGVYLLDAVARLELSGPVRQALENGVDLHIAWEVDLERYRRWWLDADVASLVQRNRIEYHELSLQYIVTNLNTGERRSFTRLASALDSIGTLVGFPVVDSVLIEEPSRYRGFVRVRLEHDRLPLPLRPTALFSDAWDLESEWRPWRFE
ncbi:MAG: DUF4390 domain-containing protein [Halofilum sp. (in: g-proteobacteria)]|nr:DUF4390 domain-containing protein [Halofilum sp. (in: g-proteobacteria)]